MSDGDIPKADIIASLSYLTLYAISSPPSSFICFSTKSLTTHKVARCPTIKPCVVIALCYIPCSISITSSFV